MNSKRTTSNSHSLVPVSKYSAQRWPELVASMSEARRARWNSTGAGYCIPCPLGRAFLGRSNRYVSNSAIISDVQAWLSLGLYCGEYAEESSY